MKILFEKIKKLEQLEKVADEAEARYTEQPESEELGNAFDEAYKAEFDAYISTAKYIEYMTGGAVNFMTAKKLIQTKRAELLQLLA
ncbi:TPA: hypothetical protein CPT81_00020 [Candidatus Gastranaerophilales bacterium HUM_20]|jgi:hypothetical protein|nr:MAG TPA: hypothetical protein CPT81_00020 [Candidatus Gastranaerophilales bacterium HUM_20]